MFTEIGEKYYFHPSSGRSAWTLPAGAVAIASASTSAVSRHSTSASSAFSSSSSSSYSTSSSSSSAIEIDAGAAHPAYSAPALQRLHAPLAAPSPAFYHTSTVADAELPHVTLHMFTDPWIKWSTRSSFGDCSSHCSWTSSANIGRADAVVFSMPTSYGSGLPPRAHPEQFYISLVLEGDETGVGRLRKLHSQFDLHSSYALESDIPALYSLPTAAEMQRAPPAKRAGKVAAWISSRCVEPRNTFVAELMRHMPIDSFGKCLHNADLPAADDATLLARLGEYKFVIAVENSLEDGYVTEKFWQGFVAGTVPVYVGDSSVHSELLAPGAHSFIFADDFPNAKDLAAHLMMLAAPEHEALYQRFFDWKREPLRAEFSAYQRLDWSTLPCRMCRRVALMKLMGHTRADLERLKAARFAQRRASNETAADI